MQSKIQLDSTVPGMIQYWYGLTVALPGTCSWYKYEIKTKKLTSTRSTARAPPDDWFVGAWWLPWRGQHFLFAHALKQNVVLFLRRSTILWGSFESGGGEAERTLTRVCVQCGGERGENVTRDRWGRQSQCLFTRTHPARGEPTSSKTKKSSQITNNNATATSSGAQASSKKRCFPGHGGCRVPELGDTQNVWGPPRSSGGTGQSD